jgi:LuxR family maltose regulon positive regulatory protein
MASPLVETKLFTPRLRPGGLPRHRLTQRLRQGMHARLTLVSAPAGFGKTTALVTWLAEPAPRPRSVAWLSLDADDNVPRAFWTYVVTALRRALPAVGEDALRLLESPNAPVDSALATVLNELAAVPQEVVLVLDDYHFIDHEAISSGMSFLLERLPTTVHIVLSTRADPALPLARLRARGDLVEVRAGDLRFTPVEVAAYVDGAVGPSLDAEQVAILEERTEGWIVALQLAALSVNGRTDVADFIASFSGDDRYVVDYLVEEVLGRQTPEVRDFLVDTCILDRLTAPLCDAVTGQPGGKVMLENLERANLFVVPLDAQRRWYRYHHLFADVLRAHLKDDRADDIPELHRRASKWYQEAGEMSAAVRHAVHAGDVDSAAALVESAIPDLRRSRQDSIIRGWVDVIPADVVQNRPVLAVLFVGALMAAGEFDGVEQRLDDIQRQLDAAEVSSPTSSTSTGPDPSQLAGLPAAVQMYRAALALTRGDTPATTGHARMAMDAATEEDHLTRAAASAIMGLASWGEGDLDSAHRSYSTAVDGMRHAGHFADILACSITLADIRLTQGRLGDAADTYEQALLLNDTNAGAVLTGTADMHVGLAHIATERGELKVAAAHLLCSHHLGDGAGLPQNPYRWRVATARLKQAQGDSPAALALLDEAQSVYTADFSPNVRPIPAMRARVLAAHGFVGDAMAWANDQGLSAQDDLSYLREYEHVTLARVLMARHALAGDLDALDTADALMDRLLVAAQAGRRNGTMIEVLTLRSLTGQSRGDLEGALARLAHALRLAEPEGYVRVFADEGPPMAALLKVTASRHTAWVYVNRLLAACRAPGEHHAEAGLPRDNRGRLGHQPVEALSPRELEVLRLLSTELDGPAVARHLVVSLNTVRTHTRNIYTKLGVNSRRAAVRRSKELGLL